LYVILLALNNDISPFSFIILPLERVNANESLNLAIGCLINSALDIDAAEMLSENYASKFFGRGDETEMPRSGTYLHTLVAIFEVVLLSGIWKSG